MQFRKETLNGEFEFLRGGRNLQTPSSTPGTGPELARRNSQAEEKDAFDISKGTKPPLLSLPKSAAPTDGAGQTRILKQTELAEDGLDVTDRPAQEEEEESNAGDASKRQRTG